MEFFPVNADVFMCKPVGIALDDAMLQIEFGIFADFELRIAEGASSERCVSIGKRHPGHIVAVGYVDIPAAGDFLTEKTQSAAAFIGNAVNRSCGRKMYLAGVIKVRKYILNKFSESG